MAAITTTMNVKGDALFVTAASALVIAAIITGDFGCCGRSMPHDAAIARRTAPTGEE